MTTEIDHRFAMLGQNEIYTKLSAPFAVHHTDPRGFTYVTGQQVIERLNEVLGPGCWSFMVKEHGFDAESDEVWVVGRLEARIDGRDVIREQCGSQKHNRRRNDKGITDFGFDMKGAATDAMKKCATMIGVALYLSEKEGGTLNMDSEENYRCSMCNTTITTSDGELINIDQAKMLRDRFGALFCKDHRPSLLKAINAPQ